MVAGSGPISKAYRSCNRSLVGPRSAPRSSTPRARRQRTGVVDAGVGEPILLRELQQLGALGDAACVHGLLVEVDHVAIPAQLPGAHDHHGAPAVLDPAHADTR